MGSLVKSINIWDIEFLKFLNRSKSFHWYRCVPKNDNEANFFRNPPYPHTKFKTGSNMILSYLTPFNRNKWHKMWFCPVSPHLIEINDIRLKWRWSFLDSSIATLNVLSKSSISKGLFYLSFMGIMCNYIPYCYGWVWTSKPRASFYAIFIL